MAVGGIVLIKALLARTLFVTHALVCMLRVHKYSMLDAYMLVIPILFLLVETYYTIKYKKNGDWKWFCPAVFLFLCSVVPALWILELNMESEYVDFQNATSQESVMTSAMIVEESLDFYGMELLRPVRLSPRVWANVLEQLLLLVLIFGRWLLPKAQIGREKLSQLLMGYIGMSADILELNEAFVEPKIMSEPFVLKLILGCWSSGVFQFSFVLTSHRKKRNGRFDPCGPCFTTDLWSIFVACFMQDIPFLALRLYLIIAYNIVNELNIFFVCKNTLVLMLQVYRVYSICRESLCGGCGGVGRRDGAEPGKRVPEHETSIDSLSLAAQI